MFLYIEALCFLLFILLAKYARAMQREKKLSNIHTKRWCELYMSIYVLSFYNLFYDDHDIHNIR
jgi:hypothetical protein